MPPAPTTINLLLTTDERYAQHCAVCIRSIIDNNNEVGLNIVVAGLALSQETINKLMSFNADDSCKITVVQFDERKLKEFPEIGVYPKDIYIRLWVEELFPTEDKVLYLDVDTIVVAPLLPLWETDLGENILAAVDIPDSTSHNRCHLPAEYSYFNSGVILFNVTKWQRLLCRKTICDFLWANAKIALNPDQDALNGCFYKNRLVLDYHWNLISPFFKNTGFPSITKEKILDLQLNPKIIHFNGAGGKPWHFTSLHPYQSKYFYYLSRTPYFDFLPADKSLINILKKHVRRVFSLDTFISIPPHKLKGQ